MILLYWKNILYTREEIYFHHLCEISDEMEFYCTKWSMFFPFLQLLFCFYDLYHI